MAVWVLYASMEQTNATTNAAPTEYDSIDGAAKRTLTQNGKGVWQPDAEEVRR